MNNIKNIWQNYRAWFQNLPLKRKIIPLCAVVGYWVAISIIASAGFNQGAVGLILLVLFYGGPYPEKIGKFFLPFILTGIVYDAHRHFVTGLRNPIRVLEPYLYEKALFGFETAGKILTPNEYMANLYTPALDFVTGVFYLTFMATFLCIAGWMYFISSRHGTPVFNAQQMKARVPQIMWALFTVNMLGYLTYFLHPAAPPWYFEQYGPGPADLAASPPAAGGGRSDALLGLDIFKGMYSQNANVFGAIPSLHCAYPALILVYAFYFRTLRIVSAIYFLGVTFSAAHPNHHYTIDVMVGVIYSFVIGSLFIFIWEKYFSKNTEEDRFF